MLIDSYILDSLTAQAKASPRLRMNLDLRNSPEDMSQRMLNAIEPGTVMPIHRMGAKNTKKQNSRKKDHIKVWKNVIFVDIKI